MSNLISRQEEYKVRKKLVLENIRRVFFASLACVVLVPILLIINNASASDFAGTEKGVLVFFEIFSVVAVGISYTALRTRNIQLSTLVYRSFWLLFEMFSFVIIYADKVSEASLSFYPVMSIVLFLAPAMALSEQLYYVVILAVYSVFMTVSFKPGINEVFNMLMVVAMLFAMSRLLYARLSERLLLKEHEREYHDREALDALTGLLSRKGFDKRAYVDLHDCIASRRRVSLLMIDIDEMGRYNDSYGTERGDECIRSVAEYVRQIVLRNTDIVCRLNGGRFLVFMEGGDDMEALTLAEKVRTNIERKRIPHGRRAVNSFVTVSVGVASGVLKSESDFSELYDEAEDAMFEAKEQGRNVTVYDEQVYGSYMKRAAY